MTVGVGHVSQRVGDNYGGLKGGCDGRCTGVGGKALSTI